MSAKPDGCVKWSPKQDGWLKEMPGSWRLPYSTWAWHKKIVLLGCVNVRESHSCLFGGQSETIWPGTGSRSLRNAGCHSVAVIGGRGVSRGKEWPGGIAPGGAVGSFWSNELHQAAGPLASYWGPGSVSPWNPKVPWDTAKGTWCSCIPLWCEWWEWAQVLLHVCGCCRNHSVWMCDLAHWPTPKDSHIFQVVQWGLVKRGLGDRGVHRCDKLFFGSPTHQQPKEEKAYHKKS